MTSQTITKPPSTFGASLGRLSRQREYGVLALLLLTVFAVGSINHTFLSGGNLRDILVSSVPAVIVACGLTLVIVLGEIDISMGALMGLLATVMGQLTSPTHANLPVAVGIAATLALGAGVGLLNGLLVAYGRMPSIIVTLGMLTVLQGVNLTLINGRFITDLPQGLRFFGIGTFLGVPVSIWTAVIVVLLAILLVRQTPLGRRIYAAGSNPEAARLAGLPVRGLKVFVFTLTGLLVAVAAVVSVPRLGVIESGIGQGFELLAVTCVVVGGTSISGGRGTIIGSVLAALLLSVISPMLIFLRLGVSATYWERAIQGAFILVAVLIDHMARGRREAH
ncbi:sugar ABC transporter permease [Capsulimonas corticalis]|uniref:Autoinducer 2 import system permease protein LsrC n=1 Tax=Capsulimonas corticalis TaxID=2219043 RepID=A0A402D482_9BACT|nr:ABC transporter permease [Capsulimonas corticalis]BDI31196.1 sugar ABC transporter permease [Capsulimonas corticalis]